MALIADGVTPTQLLSVDNSFKALRASIRPLDHLALGQYRVATFCSLVVSQALNSYVFSMRWTDATRLCVVQSLKCVVQQTAAATATITPIFTFSVARSFTVSDSVGTAIAFGGNNQKMRTSMGSTLMGDMRVSAVAAGLTAGTRAVDVNPFLTFSSQQVITTPRATPDIGAFDATSGNVHPIVLAQNEGIVGQLAGSAFGAAGTANLVVEVVWAEVAAF